jgi:hypothetical protein
MVVSLWRKRMGKARNQNINLFVQRNNSESLNERQPSRSDTTTNIQQRIYTDYMDVAALTDVFVRYRVNLHFQRQFLITHCHLHPVGNIHESVCVKGIFH